MAAKIYKINFKSDFVLTIQSDAGWAIPFCIKFWTGAPSKAYFVGYDGTNYHNCRMGETSDKLVVLFDDHHLPIGDLQMQIAYHTTIEDFPSVQFDEVTNPVIVKTEIDGQEYNVMLDFTGETAPEIEFSLPAYYNEQQRIANEQERERIFAEMQQAFATMQRESGAATAGAENVNAQLNGTTLTVTDRTGHQTSSNVQGPPGPPGSGVQADWSETDPSADDYIKNKPTIPTVPTNVSAFNNDAGYITKTVNDLVNYYLKSETYTKQEVQALINAVKQFTYEVVQTLPTATADTMNKIYLVPSADPQTRNVKDEYITIDNGTEGYTWEQIGSTAIDLSGYVTTTALNTALADYTTTEALTLLLAGKQDTINDLSTIRSGAAAGATAYQKPSGGIPVSDLALGMDNVPTSGSDNFVKSGGVYSALQGKQDVIDSSHKLSADLVDDTNTTNKFTNATEKQTWNNKQDALVSGTNIKTINNESLLGSGNISVAAELPNNLAYTSNDNGEGIIPSDGIRAVTVTSAATMTINPDVVTVIDGAVGTAAITLQVPQDNLAHVWDILMTTDSSVAITFAMSNSATILTPGGFSIGASKAVEISVIGVGTKYHLRYGEFA